MGSGNTSGHPKSLVVFAVLLPGYLRVEAFREHNWRSAESLSFGALHQHFPSRYRSVSLSTAMDQIQDQLDPEVAAEVIVLLNKKVANLRGENAKLQVRPSRPLRNRPSAVSEPNRIN